MIVTMIIYQLGLTDPLRVLSEPEGSSPNVGDVQKSYHESVSSSNIPILIGSPVQSDPVHPSPDITHDNVEDLGFESYF